MGMKPLSSPTLTTDSHGFYGHPKYIIRQAMGGNGLGLDIGITSNEFDGGYRFGISIINLFGTIKWTQDHFMRSMLVPSINQTDYYLRPNELMYVNMLVDSVTYENLGDLDNLEDPLVYYETYKVISLDDTSNATYSDLVVSLDDGTYLYPSGGDYKLNVIMGDGDTTYTLSDTTDLGGDNSFKTRQPMYLRMGISRRWEDQAVIAADLVTGFSNYLGSSSSWRLSIGTEITRFKNKFIRLGYAFGGLTKKSISIGYGRKLGPLQWDIGLSLNGGFNIDSTKGIDIAMGLMWQLWNTKY